MVRVSLSGMTTGDSGLPSRPDRDLAQVFPGKFLKRHEEATDNTGKKLAEVWRNHLNLLGGALNPAPVSPAPVSPFRRWAIWGYGAVVLVVIALAGQQIFVGAGSAPATGAQAQMSPELRATIAELKSFVEKERGLKFKEEVDVTLLSEAEFKKYVATSSEESAEAGDDIASGQVVFEALGLIDKNIDLDALGDKIAGQGVLGWYDSEADKLFVRGNRITPFLKTILVHELTHALQDQHFDIVRDDLYEADDDSSLGLEAVVEGDAGRVEYAYYESLTAEEERLVELEANDAGDPITTDIPEALLTFIGLPYALGPVFLEAMFQAGGTAKINEVLKNPPVTSEQLLYPELYLRGEGAKFVAKPPADGVVVDDGMFSQIALMVVLSEAMDRETAFDAADGWGGDQYVAWRNGEQSCLRFDMVMDSPRDQRELNTALGIWAKHHGSAKVATVGAATRMTACV